MDQTWGQVNLINDNYNSLLTTIRIPVFLVLFVDCLASLYMEAQMVTDQQVRRYLKLAKTEKILATAAAKAGMDPKTARKYSRLARLPSEVKKPHTWRTRRDAFTDVWHWCSEQLRINPRIRGKTLFQALQRHYPGRFQDGQLRTLQRHVKRWLATEGPGKEVFFSQVHRPGELCQSDFTHMNKLGVTINGQPFEHMLYHFVLTYSNWEDCSICFSESFESLSEGLQNALWRLGAVPMTHRTDQLTAAVYRLDDRKEFTNRYKELLNWYGLEGQKTQPRHPNENGDVEQSHYRFKDAIEQALMLRGSPDFTSRADYERFFRQLLDQLNAGRQKRLVEESAVMRQLPMRRQESCKHLKAYKVVLLVNWALHGCKHLVMHIAQ